MTQRHSQVILLSVSKFAKAANTTPRTIRFYEKTGLIKPAKIDDINNYRFYLPQQTIEIFRIRLLQDLNLSLKEIARITSKRKFYLEANRQLILLQNGIEERKRRLACLRQINSLLDGKFDRLKFRKEYLGPYELFSLHLAKADYGKIEEYIRELRVSVKKFHFTCLKSEMVFYHRYKYTPIATPLTISLILKKKPKKIPTLQSNYSLDSFPRTQVLTYDFKGPYTYLPLIHEYLDTYVKSNKIKAQPPIIEYYIRNPLHKISSYDYLTKIAYPI